MIGVGRLLLALGLGTAAPTLVAVAAVVGAGVLFTNRSSNRWGGDVVADRVIFTDLKNNGKFL